tara:strand:- start:378 stop:485 length:108 start_codon:yes stop_codon:yes gene_type:complete
MSFVFMNEPFAVKDAFLYVQDGESKDRYPINIDRK